MKRLTIISKFAWRDNHSALDDERYFDFFIKMGINFRLYTSQYSIDQIRSKHPENQSNLYSIKNTPIEIEAGGRVIFLGYSELDVITFLGRNLPSRPRLILVATNNFSSKRVKRRYWALKLFFQFVKPFLDRLVLHTEYERALVARLDHEVAQKSYVKKHHLMTPINIESDGSGGKLIISYFGPMKHDKPISPFLNLIRADIERRFHYRIYNVNPTILAKYFPDLKCRINVEVIDVWQSYASYLRSIKESTLIFLAHNRAFEGKLSGNLCDCFALQVPYIAQVMEPMTSYESMYGPLGYLFDLEDSNWVSCFLDNFSTEFCAEMSLNLKSVANFYSKEKIDADLAACFLK